MYSQIEISLLVPNEDILEEDERRISEDTGKCVLELT